MLRRHMPLLVLWSTLLSPAAALALTAGPDDFGYTLADQNEAGVDFSWHSTLAEPDAQRLDLMDDEISMAIPIGFEFQFYGVTYSDVSVSSNGFLTFAPPLAYEFFQGTQCPLPMPSAVDALVAIFMRDLNPDSAGVINILHGGVAPNRWFLVEFSAVPRWTDNLADDPDPINAQVILFEGSNQIKVQIQEAGIFGGADAMVGIEAADGIAGLSLPGCMTEGHLADEAAIVFTPPQGGTPVLPAARQAYALPGESIAHDFLVFNLESTDVTFDLSVSGNAWDTQLPQSTLTVPTGYSGTFSVTIDIDPQATGGAVDAATITLTPQSGGESVEVRVVTLTQDPPDQWQLVSEVPLLLDSPMVAGLGSDLWLAGGMSYDDLAMQKYPSNQLQVLHTGTWQWDHSDQADGGSLAPLPEAALKAAGCAMNGLVYVAGGIRLDQDLGEFGPSDKLDIYVVDDNNWVSGPALPEARSNAAAVCDAATSTLYLIAGLGPVDQDGLQQPTSTVWAYHAQSDTWDASLTSSWEARSDHSAALLPSGDILVAGGWVDGALSTHSTLYGIAADDWRRTGDLPWEIVFNGAGLLDGRMCLMGGTTFAGGALNFLDDTFVCYSNGYWIPQIATQSIPATFCAGGTVDDRLYLVGGVDTDNLGGNPTYYTQMDRVERYPWAEIDLPDPDGGPDGDDGDGGMVEDGDGEIEADGDGDTVADGDGETVGDGDGGPLPDGGDSGEGDGDGGGADGTPMVCDPGATQLCYCSADQQGVQICADDGRSWGSCECEEKSGGGGCGCGTRGGSPTALLFVCLGVVWGFIRRRR